MGAGDTDEAEYYFKKLMKITVIVSVAWNAIILAATPLMLMAYDLSAETKMLVIWLVVIHNVFNAFAMCTDWLFRSVLFEVRLRKGTWKQFKVI